MRNRFFAKKITRNLNAVPSHTPIKYLIQTIIDEWHKELHDDLEDLHRAFYNYKKLYEDFDVLRCAFYNVRRDSRQYMSSFCNDICKFKSNLSHFRENVSKNDLVYEEIERLEWSISILKIKQLALNTLMHVQHGDIITATDQQLLSEKINNEIRRNEISIGNKYSEVGSYLAMEYKYTYMGNEMYALTKLFKLRFIVSHYPGIKIEKHTQALHDNQAKSDATLKPTLPNDEKNSLLFPRN